MRNRVNGKTTTKRVHVIVGSANQTTVSVIWIASETTRGQTVDAATGASAVDEHGSEGTLSADGDSCQVGLGTVGVDKGGIESAVTGSSSDVENAVD